MRWIAWVEYTGTAYSGWQKQGHAPSVQCVVEEALSRVANHKIDVVCAGRTDTGVHALAQLVHFDSSAERTPRSWMLGANANLPDDVCLRDVASVPGEFHARYSALWRRYRYVIDNRLTRPALFNKRVAWFYRALDEVAMHEAAQCLVGEHDFSSFRAAGCQARHAVRKMHWIKVERKRHFVIIEVCANAFLHHMVRNIVGSLIEIGVGDKPPEWLEVLLAMRDRAKAGITAPAHGLYFTDVGYPVEYGLSSPFNDMFMP